MSDSSSTSERKREEYLLERLGGMVALKSIIQEFCRRVTRDRLLQPFLQDADPRVLTAHQERFFAMAFTKVDVANATIVIRRAHRRLFARGLCEEHFDVFVSHFAQTLRDRGFGAAIVEEALDILAPLREVFQNAAQEQEK